MIRNMRPSAGAGTSESSPTVYNYVALVVPALVVGPMYMRGEIEFGVVTQAEIAFAQVLAAVSVIVSYFENLSASAAGVQRISDLCDAFDNAEAEEVQMAEAAQIAVSKSRKRLKTKRLTVQTPDSRRTLARNLSFDLKPGALTHHGRERLWQELLIAHHCRPVADW